MTERVRPRRVAFVAGALAAVTVLVVFLVQPVPDRVVSALGGPRGGIERIGGVRLRYRPPAGLSEQDLGYYLRQRTQIRRDGDVLVVDLPHLTPDTAGEAIDVLVAGGLAMREVLDDAHYAGAIAEAAPLPEGVTVETDQWRDEDGQLHSVPFLGAPARPPLDQAIANARAHGWAPPPNSELAFEYSTWGPLPQWRSYLISTAVAIDGTMIANATGSYDPNTNRPIVLLDFTREGGERFCELTGRIRGHKLATMLGGAVRSAPIIMSRICGGRASVTMGGSDPERQERERDMLVTVLRAGAVPRGGTIEAQDYLPPASVAVPEWLGRGLLALIAGALVGLGFGVVVRIARPVRRRAPEPVAGPFPVRRLIVTLLAPVALFAGSRFTLPGINEIELAAVISRSGSGSLVDPTPWSVLALGWMPILTAFGIVELVALAVPWWRWRRHDPLGRVGLGRAVAWLGIALALVQGYFVAIYLEALSRGGAEVVVDPGWRFRLITMITLAAGTALLAALAGMIREHGLGNGYAALGLSAVLVRLAGPVFEGPLGMADQPAHATTLGLVVLIAMVAGTAALLRWRIGDGERAAELRLPTSGIVPLSDAGGLALLIGLVTGLGLGEALFDQIVWAHQLRSHAVLVLGFAIASIPIWSWLFARPALTARPAMQAGLPIPSWSAWLRATLVSTAMLGALAIAGELVREIGGAAALLATAAVAVVGTATILDIVDDARAHRRTLAPAGVLHQIQYAGLIERVLGDAGIPCHIHASNIRTLFAFFGPWAPAIVLVPEAQAADARKRIDDVLRPATATIPMAQVRD